METLHRPPIETALHSHPRNEVKEVEQFSDVPACVDSTANLEGQMCPKRLDHANPDVGWHCVGGASCASIAHSDSLTRKYMLTP